MELNIATIYICLALLSPRTSFLFATMVCSRVAKEEAIGKVPSTC